MERDDVPAHLLEHGRIAELTPGQPPCIVRRHALADEFFFEQPQVEVELDPRLAILLPRKGRAEAEEQPLQQPGHQPSCRTAATAAAIEFHRSVSLASSRVPRLVNR